MSKHVARFFLLAAGASWAAFQSGCCTGRCPETGYEAGLPTILTQPVDKCATNIGEPLKIAVQAAPYRPDDQLTYQWFKLEAVACGEEPVTNESPLTDRTNNVLEFLRLPDDYGLYFCEILDHPGANNRPPFGAIRESRSRLVSVSGPAEKIHAEMLTVPVIGSVLAGNGGQNSCVSSSRAYVVFAGDGSGIPADPANATHCMLTLTNLTTGVGYTSSNYKATANEGNKPYDFLCVGATNNGYLFSFSQPQKLVFTISFTGITPPAGTKVILGLHWY